MGGPVSTQMLTAVRSTIIAAAVISAAVVVPAQAAQNRPVPSDVGPLGAGGGFVIQSCGEGASTLGWTIATPDPGSVAAGLQCPPVRGHVASLPAYFDQTGIWVSDRLGRDGGSVDAAVGDHADITFDAQPGTTISRARYWRKITKTADDNWSPYVAVDSPSQVLETCEIGGQVACQVGADDWYPNDSNPELDRTAYVDRPGLHASRLIVGLTCRANMDNLCGPGYSIPHVEAQLYSVYLTIADADGPILGSPSGSAWADHGWVQGSKTLAVPSTDTSGIAATSTYVDGSLVATALRTCAYDRPRPCSDEPTGSMTLATAALPDGNHTLEIAAVDAAGNETRAIRPTAFRVDNTAPSAPQNLRPTSPTSSTNSFAVTWSLPHDDGSPIVAARYQLCQGVACGAVQTAPGLTSLADVSLPAPGSATLRVWLVDQLGHENLAGGSEVVLTYAPVTAVPSSPPTAPVAPLPPVGSAPPAPPSISPPGSGAVPKADPRLRLTTVRRAGRRVTIAGSLSSRAAGRVTVRYSVRVHGRTRTVTRKAAIRRGSFRLVLTLSRSFALSRTATVSVAYAGDVDTKSARRSATLRVSAR